MTLINMNNSGLEDLFKFYAATSESEKVLDKLDLVFATRRFSNLFQRLDEVRESDHISDLRNYRNLSYASSNGGQIQNDILENWCLENNQGSVMEVFKFLLKDYTDQIHFQKKPAFQLGNEFLDEIEFSYVAAQVANSVNGYTEYISPLWDRLSEQEFEKGDNIASEVIDTIRTEAINIMYNPNLLAIRMNSLVEKLRKMGFEL